MLAIPIIDGGEKGSWGNEEWDRLNHDLMDMWSGSMAVMALILSCSWILNFGLVIIITVS